ncbi:MAG: SDR family oxidoreductase [Planctomycetaceae bacterium]|nr:SDR family oxidoreductase [Planctomycetaceae bacterium]
MTNYLVTGGAGFIGSHIATRLVNDGHSVRVFDNLSTGALKNLEHLQDQVEFVQGDLRDLKAVEEATRGIEIIFHQAALASVPRSVEHPLDTHEACVTGTIHVLDAARRLGVQRVVYAGSSSAYGNQKQMPKHEGQTPEVLSPYAAAKLAGELYCQAFANSYDLETVRIRYFNVFGPRQDPNSPYSAVIPLFAAALLEGRRPVIYGDGTQSRDFTYVDNVVEANLLASQADAGVVSGNVYNVACGSSLNLIDLLKSICEQLGKPYDPDFQPRRTGDVLHSWADISAAQRDLGYAPVVDIKEGLRRTIEWYTAYVKAESKPCLGGC